MTSELQRQHEDMNAFDMIEHLKTLYQEQARIERFEVSKALFSAKLSEGSLVSPHVLKMIGYVGNLEKLGFPLGNELATDLILQSLPESFNQFVLNFTMSDMEKTLPQLLGMLRQAEQNMKTKGKSNHVLMIGNGNKGKGNKGKGASTTLWNRQGFGFDVLTAATCSASTTKVYNSALFCCLSWSIWEQHMETSSRLKL
ncbi:unnamed protein product [Trifolium pratense]|uniref:Uncharacterized protein n=1 Tax=Trifolium pratense TaxID=57577 RepID=A0ACB0I858_TRIPR|nr:unnamed protein product [Trifolium pratense]